ncbi:energy transducer TonB [Luteibacter aegosomaticola]|uniref:energy transducer TonB n=1 Tax=Luteibacter aegosomaticola TaxID=2911538 RepID=UPI001FF86DEC|nr:TonB family protein [Luteibacter aegosomaticola]UPG92151.1 energy transducer TonB [Luteibacter aegosomaticola]
MNRRFLLVAASLAFTPIGAFADDGTPALARQNTLVEAHVDKEGHVTREQLITSSGSPDADARALAAVQKWQFKPALVKGKPVEVNVRVPVVVESKTSAAAASTHS